MTDYERIAILETKVVHIREDVKTIREGQEEVLKRVDDMHDVFMQAKGARWAFLLMAAVGGFISAKLVPILQGFGLIR